MAHAGMRSSRSPFFDEGLIEPDEPLARAWPVLSDPAGWSQSTDDLGWLAMSSVGYSSLANCQRQRSPGFLR